MTRIRDVYTLLGLPFDAVSMEDTVKAVLQAVRDKEQLFLSTPNLNFLIAAQKNEQFRESVINSELSIADGMPIVFMCKLLGIPIKERVAGSSLVEALIENDDLKENPITVFFFGGEDGVAEKAHEALNEMSGGLKSVGHLNPGFGTVEDMSSPKIIKEINDCKPDFIIVSLGAAKGQAWIEANRDALKANVISHLGAVVNFVAGTVKRAPVWVQKIHMEWLWRIKEEPALFGRYWNDGLSFLKLLIFNILPLRWIIRAQHTYSTPKVVFNDDDKVLYLSGSIIEKNEVEFSEIIEKIVTQKIDFTIDLQAVTYIDPFMLGQLMDLRRKMTGTGCQFRIKNMNKRVAKIIDLSLLSFMVE